MRWRHIYVSFFVCYEFMMRSVWSDLENAL